MSDFNPIYSTKLCSKLTKEELEQCSDLFSNHYGFWSDKAGNKAGKRIKYSAARYFELGKNPNMYVSLCKEREHIIGQAFFLKKQIDGKGICSWVTQLVVHSSYRRRRIGERLLYSAWGFSNYYAWGLATANAITIKTLQAATWREINVDDILANISVIEELCKEVPFAHSDRMILDSEHSQIFTDFYPEFERVNEKEEFQVFVEKLGTIEDGCEWLAFVFRPQPLKYDKERFEAILSFSMNQLQEAYGRMDMSRQPWTRGTVNEIDYVEKVLGLNGSGTILDLGCGQGRHSFELAKRGYCVTGVDFSERLLKKALSEKKIIQTPSFVLEDVRKYRAKEKQDAVVCLYDVIGSFRDEKENYQIIRSIWLNLKPKGRAVVSVMNMELTEHLVKYRGNVKENPELLLTLNSSNIMRKSGDIFDPDYYLIDSVDGLVYRREQFEDDDDLAAEYIVADRRYTKLQIISLFQSIGFKIIDVRYVQAGHWDKSLEPTDKKAKEIVLVVEHK